MKIITLNDYLNHENVWAKRLLGMEAFQQERTKELVMETYGSSIWKDRLNEYGSDPEALKDRVLNPSNDIVKVSFGDQIVSTQVSTYHSIVKNHMLQMINQFSSAPEVCELGCGFGPNLLRMGNICDRNFYGGEFAPAGVELSKILGLDVELFDYYEQKSYDLVREKSTVMTVHSVEQIPDATPIIESLRSIKSRIDCVIHFEPLYRTDRESFLGLIRNRYHELNDYNTNLHECLTSADDIEILFESFDHHGLNPLNPSSTVVWRFR